MDVRLVIVLTILCWEVGKGVLTKCMEAGFRRVSNTKAFEKQLDDSFRRIKEEK